MWVDAVGSGLICAPNKKDFGVANDDVGFLELYAASADRFHLPTLERHARLESLLDKIVVESFLVIDNAHRAGG